MYDLKEYYRGVLDIEQVPGETREQKREKLERMKEEIFRSLVRSFDYDVWINDDKLMVVGDSKPMVRGLIMDAKGQLGGVCTIATMVSKDACTC